jgi:pyruvate formate lyase activating enzyme
MTIHGFQKMTLLDYPGRVACTLFTAACNLRCPFCHNAGLVTKIDTAERIDEEEIFSYLKKRQGILDGVCITGGEPTLQKDLPEFIRAIRALGYAVKLDTNGTSPDLLKALIDEGLVDYVAMDVKNAPEKYPLTVGLADYDITPIQRSIDLLLEGRVDYEFRTTVVAEYHTPEDIASIARWIEGAPRYFLQPFVDSGNLIGSFDGQLHAPDATTLNQMLTTARAIIPASVLRGA